jgi:membrane-bound lytic murein transglycosylase D
LKYRFSFMAIVFTFAAFVASSNAQDVRFKLQPSVGQALLEAIKIDKPINFCGETVPVSDPEIKERLERELLYALDNNDDIILWLKRANRYFPHIEKVLKNSSMPDDLKFITIAESALRPHASSNKGAVGYWQFIEGTGMRYGMEISSAIDDRRNFFTSTEAALRY